MCIAVKRQLLPSPPTPASRATPLACRYAPTTSYATSMSSTRRRVPAPYLTMATTYMTLRMILSPTLESFRGTSARLAFWMCRRCVDLQEEVHAATTGRPWAREIRSLPRMTTFTDERVCLFTPGRLENVLHYSVKSTSASTMVPTSRSPTTAMIIICAMP